MTVILMILTCKKYFRMKANANKWEELARLEEENQSLHNSPDFKKEVENCISKNYSIKLNITSPAKNKVHPFTTQSFSDSVNRMPSLSFKLSRELEDDDGIPLRLPSFEKKSKSTLTY